MGGYKGKERERERGRERDCLIAVCVWGKERWEGFLWSLLKETSIAASTAGHTLLFPMISFLRFSFHFLLPHCWLISLLSFSGYYLSYDVMLHDAFLCFVHVWLSCVTIFVYNVKGRPFRPLLINLLQDLNFFFFFKIRKNRNRKGSLWIAKKERDLDLV